MTLESSPTGSEASVHFTARFTLRMFGGSLLVHNAPPIWTLTTLGSAPGEQEQAGGSVTWLQAAAETKVGKNACDSEEGDKLRKGLILMGLSARWLTQLLICIPHHSLVQVSSATLFRADTGPPRC